jgi:hypothetical protein
LSGIWIDRELGNSIDALALGVMEGMPEKRTMYLLVDRVLPIDFLQQFPVE